MIIASQKRKENIAEYLLYMWHIEDLIRANELDIDKIKENVIFKYQNLSPEQIHEMTGWYESLIDMMRTEGVEKSGHLQLNKNILLAMVSIHRKLLQDTDFPDYTAEFYRTLPYIVELRAKADKNKSGEIETCMNALYGMLLMRLQGREISKGTIDAMTQISHFIAVLSRNFRLDEEDALFKHD